MEMRSRLTGMPNARPTVLALVVVCVAAGSTAWSPTAAQPGRELALTKAQWREDLREFARELPKRHKNVYHATSREQFERAVADLDAAIPSLQDHQIIVKLQQIAATVGDGHTGVRIPPSFRIYPLALYWFGRELRVIAAGPAYPAALGARLVGIGGVAIDEVLARVRTCFPSAENENEWYVLATSPAFIVRPEVLQALGIVSRLESAAFTLLDDQGRESTIEIQPVAVPPADGVATLGLTPAAKQPPIYRQRPTESLWFTDLPGTKTTYVNFRRYASLGDRARELFAHVDRQRPDRFVIDLRQNGGGDFFEGRKHLIAPLKQRPALNQKGHLFVIVGRQTFSAAMVNAIDFKKETNAIIVGEPIGRAPEQLLGERRVDPSPLAARRLVFDPLLQISRRRCPGVRPDVRIDPNWPDFVAGRDPVLDWILSQIQ
jgi:hypothetical protein